MSTHAQQRAWTDSDTPQAPAPSPISVQTTFRHMRTSPAIVELITTEAGKLTRYFDRITHCHVVIAAPQKRQRHGQHYSIHVELGVPHGPLVVDHDTSGSAHAPASSLASPQRGRVHQDLYATTHDAFDIVRRRLEDHARRLRGDVKHHAPPLAPEI